MPPIVQHATTKRVAFLVLQLMPYTQRVCSLYAASLFLKTLISSPAASYLTVVPSTHLGSPCTS